MKLKRPPLSIAALTKHQDANLVLHVVEGGHSHTKGTK